MKSRKYYWMLRCIAVIALVVICSHDVMSKRSGGSRSSSSRRTTSSRRYTSTSTRRTQPNYPRQSQPRPQKPIKPKIHKPPKTSGRFNKGGIKKFAKVGLALYLANKMKPSIKFRPYGGYNRNRRANYCYDCMSINGSDIGCERGSSYGRLGRCFSSHFRPYCSTEYGRTTGDLPYVRRSCNERRCNTCAKKLVDFTGNSTDQCYTIQCDMCNWNNCNGKSTQDIFHAQWSACEVDSSKTGALFTDDDNCGPRPQKPVKPKIRFNKGGIKKFSQVGLELYLTNKMKPSIKFRPYEGFDRNRSASFCYDCMSINGSDSGCEQGSSYGKLGKCFPSDFTPYCSTEYGRTIDDLPYVRRSCNERRCNTCATKPGNFTGNSTDQCYTVQCEMCNWDNCNGNATHDTFHAQWSGCEVDSSKTGALFTDDDMCGSCSVARNSFVTVFVVAFSAFLLH